MLYWTSGGYGTIPPEDRTRNPKQDVTPSSSSGPPYGALLGAKQLWVKWGAPRRSPHYRWDGVIHSPRSKALLHVPVHRIHLIEAMLYTDASLES